MLAVGLCGAVGIIIQVILARELLVLFQGNELTIGVVLALWLLLEAAGAMAARWGRETHNMNRFLVLLGLSLLSLPLSLVLVRVLRDLVGINFGQAFTLQQLLQGTFLALAPACVLHGALFTAACRAFGSVTGSHAQAAGRVYVAETLGTLLGAAALAGVLSWGWTSFRIIGILMVATACAGVAAACSARSVKIRCLAGPGLTFAMALLVLGFVVSPLYSQLHHASLRRQWGGEEIQLHRDTIYGSITVLQRQDQSTVYYDGSSLLTVPYPDLEYAETLAHLALLFHEAPGNVLILSGGLGGLLNEVQKHPVRTIDYVELDPGLLEVLKALQSPLIQQELADPRLRSVYMDGRLFIKNADTNYDVIITGVGEPTTLQVNRLYTQEFFAEARQALRDDGLLVITSPGSATHLGRELLPLNRSLYATLQSVFPHVRVIPGHWNLFLASADPALAAATAEQLHQRLQDRELTTALFSPAFVRYKLNPDRWQPFVEQIAARGDIRLNTDDHPASVFYALRHWGAVMWPELERWEMWLADHWYVPAAAVSILAILIVFWLGGARAGSGRAARAVSGATVWLVLTTGAAGMSLDLLILFAFQSAHGYVYQAMALLIAVFMAGAAWGGWLGLHRLGRMGGSALLAVELLLVAFLLGLPLCLHLGSVHPLAFLLLSLAAGVLTGCQFPLTVELLGTVGQRNSGGLVYGVDLLGGCVGGLGAAVIWVPLWGISSTAWILAAVKLTSVLFLAAALRYIHRQQKGRDGAAVD